MPSIFKKLFGRKSKQTNLTDSTPINTSGNNSSILSTKKEKSKNKKSLKKQKKKDKKAHFPSKEQPLLATSNSGGNHDKSPLLLLEGCDEVEKENSPVGVGLGLAQNGNVAGMGMNQANGGISKRGGNQNGYRNGAVPTLSLIAEESSPLSNRQLGNHHVNVKIPANQSPNILSPTMSGNKPPLTPNRLGGRGMNGKPLTPSSHRIAYPTPPPQAGRVSPNRDMSDLDTSANSPISPDNGSLRGVHMSPSAASDDMCLSSDNDDDEYNQIVHKENTAPPAGAAASSKGGKKEEKFVSALDRSPFSYGSDDDNALFPALVDDKDPFAAQDAIDASLPLPNPRLNGKISANSNNNNMQSPVKGTNKESDPNIFPMAFETQDDIRAWTPSPTKKSTFTFSGSDKMVSPSAVASSRAGATPSSNIQTKSAKTSNNHVLFENFADFEPFNPAAQQRQLQSKSSSKSVAHNPLSPVSALLEDSRNRRLSRDSANNSGNRIGGSSSINSAPVITPSYIRSQVHRSKQNEAASSFSRVIDNLELHVNKRQSNGSANSAVGARDEASSHRSHISAESAIREAKERIRRENNLANESKIIDMLASGQHPPNSGKNAGDNNWLFDEVTGTLGPRSVAADLESLGGRSNRSGKSRNSVSNKSHMSHRSKRGHRRHKSRDVGGDVSVDSRTSRNSYRSYQTTKSMVSQMSESSRSVANDLLRLEAQLSMVGKRAGGSGSSVATSDVNKRRDDCGMTVTSRDYSISRSSAGGLPRPSKGSRHISSSARRAAAMTLRSKTSVVAPPGKLGIILANRTDSRGTVVSGVRTSSVLAEQVSPGDRIIAIDDEDVSQMNVKEITTIMARKSEFERVLVLLAAPKQQYD